jgi:glycine/D-amino acid oxidase-like deaminating enzyme
MPFYTVDLPYLWGRVTAEGRLVFGAGLVFPIDGRVTAVSLAGGDATSSMERLETRVRGLHPALADVPVAARWGGPIAFRRERGPLLGPLPGHPHVIVTGAYAGHGVALSVRVGALVAEALLTGRPLPAWGTLV